MQLNKRYNTDDRRELTLCDTIWIYVIVVITSKAITNLINVLIKAMSRTNIADTA